jgi:hypothetical protein
MLKDQAWLKYLSDSDARRAESLSSLRFRESKLKRQLYRKAYHAKNKDKENGANRNRYHEKYKQDPEYKERSRRNWARFSANQSKEWSLLRSRKYRRAYSALSEKQRSAIREAYKIWAQDNWERRVEYAKEWRSRQPTTGLRKAIAEASRTGDIAKLAAVCERAISRFDEASRRKGSKSHDREGCV